MNKNKSIKKVFVEVSKTKDQLSRGLMFRKKLEDDSGMLFVFEKPQILSFWGMNTFMPLDIAFIDINGVIRSIDRIKEHNLTSVKSSCPCSYALEVSDGWFNSNGFSVGDFFEPLLSKNDSHIMLIKNNHKKESQSLSDIKTPEINTNETKEENTVDALKEQTKPDQAKPDQVKTDQDKARSEPNDNLAKVKNKDFVEPKFSSIFEALKWSMQTLNVLRITYKTLNNNIITRDIEPHKTFFSRKSNHQVLKAYDETSGHASQYIIANIISYGFPGRIFVAKSILLKGR